MAVPVDNVYQQVLAITNKEQRGYITPQEFNLFARKAQNDIFESTFQDYKDAFLHPEQVVGQHNDLNMLREKMDYFRLSTQAITVSSGTGTIDNTNGNIYWLESVYDFANNIVFEEVTKRQVNYFQSYFAAKSFPLNLEHVVFDSANSLQFRQKHVFYRESTNKVFFYPAPDSNFVPKADFVRPITDFDPPLWAFNVTNHIPLFNAGGAKNFVVHASEETTLVNKILELAGIALEKQPLSDAALRNEQMKQADKSN